jgi:hypothetical protein
LRQIARTLLKARVAEFGASSVAIFPFVVMHTYFEGEGILQSFISALAAPFLIFVFFSVFLYCPLAFGIQYGAVRLGLRSRVALSILPTLICLADGSWVIGSWSNPIRNIGLLWSAMFAMTLAVFIVNYRVLASLVAKADRASQ